MAKNLKVKIISIPTLTYDQIRTMYDLFSKYYNNTNFNDFEHQLQLEDYVTVIFKHKNIVGFSIFSYELLTDSQNKKYYGVYSGDTIIHPNYWGQTAWFQDFILFLWQLKIKTGIPVYWFLMSKGYKTYLLLTNNLTVYYPRFEETTPEKYEQLLDQYWPRLFNEHYNPQSNLIDFKGRYTRLKPDTAPVPRQALSIPEVKFFLSKNPNWLAGVELGCIGEITNGLCLKMYLKKIKTWWRNL